MNFRKDNEFYASAMREGELERKNWVALKGIVKMESFLSCGI